MMRLMARNMGDITASRHRLTIKKVKILADKPARARQCRGLEVWWQPSILSMR